MSGIANKINLNEISLETFVNLLENLDRTEKGENLFLRCYPDGGSYISNDNGDVDIEFTNFEELILWLINKKEIKK